MLRLLRVFFLIALSVNTLFTFSQSNIDSLIRVAEATKVDSQKVKLYGDISWELLSVDIVKSQLYGEKQLNLAIKIKNEPLIAQAESDIGNILNRKTQFDSAIVHYNKAILLRQKLKQPVKVAGIYSNMATVLMRQSKFKEALDFYFKALKIFEEVDDKGKQALVLGNIGNIYNSLSQTDQSLIYFRKALGLAREISHPSAEANVLVNIGGVKHVKGELDSALYYYSLSEKIFLKNNLLYALGTLYNDMGKTYFNKNQYQKSIEYYEKSLKNRDKFQDEFGVAQSSINLGELCLKTKEYDKGIEYLNNAVIIFKKNNTLVYLEKAYSLLAALYEAKGNNASALIYTRLVLACKDSIYVQQVSDQLIEMNTKYETEKKEQQNKLLLTQNELSEETIKQQRTVTYFIVTGLILVVCLAFLIFRGLKQQRKANITISRQKEMVEQKNHIIEEKQKEILDSIQYAKRIQGSILAHHEFLDENLPNNFVLFKPKDIVSGDFYWAAKHENKFYLAVCDSTGHGVPGAFMSLLNIGFLNEAIKERYISEPHKIFDYVRERLTTTVSKEGQKDGFDGILLCFDKTTNQITYAAAHNAPILISNQQLTELPKDKMPIGIGERQESFRLHTISAMPGDILYLYTDGYADQFGGEKGKKFKYKQLEDLLFANRQLALQEQLHVLNQTFENWRGNLEQVDDVCLIGIRL